MTGVSTSDTERDRIVLAEHDTSPPLTLSDTALDALEELNANLTGKRIAVEHGRDATVQLKTSQYVGTISLPDGPDVRIQPKAAGTNFLALLQWAYGITPTIHEEQTRASTGQTFLDTLGLLYAAELDSLLTRGPHREYQWTDATETRLRGRLDLQRQLQYQSVTATKFEVTYDELTTDTVANRGIQQAAARLARLVHDKTLSTRLHQQSRYLARWVSSTPVQPAVLGQVETTRLNEHYDTVLRLAEQILRHRYLDDFRPTRHSSFGLLVNMNTVFEKAVERTARAVVADQSDWRVRTQERIPPIATGGTPTVNMYPDFVLEYDGKPQLVGDAKWKTDSITQSDIYQMSAYMLALDVPGILFYPEHTDGDSIETSYLVDEQHSLLARELPTATTSVKHEYHVLLHRDFAAIVAPVLENGEWPANNATMQPVEE